MADTTANIIGVEGTDTVIGDAGTATIQAGTTATPNTNTATGTTVEGSADVTADTINQVAALDSTISIGNGGVVTVNEVSTTTASATNVGADTIDSTATAEYTGNTGGIIDVIDAAAVPANTDAANDITIGNAGQVLVTVDNIATATANSIAGDAEGTADFASSYGLLNTEVTAGAGATVSANVDANAAATAVTIGDPAGATVPADATATASFSGVTAGIYSDATGSGDISIGGGGTVSGLAGQTSDALSLVASATTVTGDAGSEASATTIAGIGGAGTTDISVGAAGVVTGGAVLSSSSTATTTLGNAEADTTATEIIGIGAADTQIDIGTTGQLTAVASVNAASSATSVTGVTGVAATADANTDLDLVAALGTGAGDVTVGSDSVVVASAASTSTATAASTAGGGVGQNTVATVNNDLVTGVDLDTLVAGNNASLTATATSTQTANASTIGAVGGAATDAAQAIAATTDQIIGVNNTAVDFGNDASKLSVSATLAATAISSNVNGADSSSEAGLGSDVFGINGGTVDVGNNLTGVNGLRVDATSNLTATATGVDGTADADAGSSATSVVGIDAVSIDVGNSGNITAVAASTLAATASTTAAAATADAYQTGDGVLDTDITVGNDGNLTAQTTLIGNATATTVGPNGGAADATANLDLDGNGISQAAGFSIDIGDVGNVSGTSFNSGGAIAQTTNGSATADGNVIAEGINLVAADSDITIGGAGNVTGLAVLGTLNSTGNLANQIGVTASAVSDDATATGNFDGAGIFGVNGVEALITAGGRDGDITGQVFAGGNVTASTTGDAAGDNATATISASDLFGISNVDLIGGQSGTNQVRGTAFGDFDATATSVAGDAIGTSTTSAYGIFGGAAADDLTVSGSVLAQAQLSNTVTATTVSGNAVATATSNAIGLSDYNVTIISGGSLTANAFSNASSTATSVGGNV
jgi:hypothetical protein